MCWFLSNNDLNSQIIKFISMIYKIQEFLLTIGLIEKKDWGYILITSIILTPITGIGLLIYFWIKIYIKSRKQCE